jgi:ATP-dependent DNA helicase RecG
MSRLKAWIEQAMAFLEVSLSPLPTEPNELDWKSGLAPNKEQLVEHVSAFANYADGGFMAIGILFDYDSATHAG